MLKHILFGLVATCSLLNLNTANKLEEWNDENFDENLAKHGKAFIKFFAPWCGHCKHLAPIWQQVADSLDPSYGAIVKVDCTTSGQETCKRFEVRGYPTLKYIKHNKKASPAEKVIDYQGSRDKEGLIGFAKKHGSPLYKDLADGEVASFLKNDVYTTFVLFTNSKSSAAFKRFEEVAEKYVGEALFGVSNMKEPSKVLDAATPESLIFKRAQRLVSNAELESGAEENIEHFGDFIKYSLHGRVALREPSNDESILRPLATVYIASSFKTNSSYFKMIRNRLLRIAEDFPEMHFAVAASSDYSYYLKEIGFDPKTDEIAFSIDDAQFKRYVPKSSVKFDDLKSLPDQLKKFLADFTDGKIEVYYKSEPIPAEPKKGEPLVVVAENFKATVTDPTKNIFLKMYAPWCGHCKKLSPVWNQLAEKFKDDPSVVIAKFDATANDIPIEEYEITGFPTLFFVKAGSGGKNPIQYSGARSLDAFVKYLEKETSKKVEDAKDEL